MTVKLNAKGYEALRERTPVIEWYAELQKGNGTPVCDRFALASYRNSAAGVTPMTFSFPHYGRGLRLAPFTDREGATLRGREWGRSALRC